MTMEELLRNTARKAGYSEQIITLLCNLIRIFPEPRDVSWCYVDEALEKHYSVSDIIKLALTAPHSAGLFDPSKPEPTIETYIPDGEELYARHCNADGSFRFEDFDTPEKLEAFKREREQLEATKHADADDDEYEEDDEDDETSDL